MHCEIKIKSKSNQLYTLLLLLYLVLVRIIALQAPLSDVRREVRLYFREFTLEYYYFNEISFLSIGDIVVYERNRAKYHRVSARGLNQMCATNRSREEKKLHFFVRVP
jgi:hypothetical protein